MSRRIGLFIVVTLLLTALGQTTIAARQAAPSTGQPPTIDAATAAQIKETKLKAQDALDAGNLEQALKLYKQILRLDPDDALALRKNEELAARIEARGEKDREGRLEREDTKAKQDRVRDDLNKAEDALIQAKRTGESEFLERASQFLVDARKYSRSGDPTIERIQAQIDQETAAIRMRRYEIWGLVGLVVVGLIVAAVFYYLRSGRVLEMIDGPQIGQQFVLQKEATALGALASEVDWAIEDPLRKISRRHCDVIRQGRHYFLVDCSMNGTFLNGRPLQKGQPALLRRGDQIGLGGAVTLRFR